jgi:bifunctional N-acetylglucosamine-1-phosphate-uridyltransferase/glucosamine-1-phosphate-acetyltransferase GlmU-like protein
MTSWDPWAYSEKTNVRAGTTDLVGCDVEATDGHIGKVDEASHDVGSSYVVVDTGPWIFGKKVLLPAGTIENVDVENKKVFVGRTKDEIKNSPKFDPGSYRQPDYRADVGNYYGRYYQTF